LGWTRTRAVFLALTLVALLVVFWLASDVLLPFILAVIIAYVLTPLVALCERVKVPRALAILIVYAITFSLIYIAAAATAPRIYRETLQLARDTPALARELTRTWGPRVDDWMAGVLGRAESKPETTNQSRPAFEIIEGDDGSLAVVLREGVDVIRESDTHWRIVPVRHEPPEKFNFSRFANESVDRFVAYVEKNALELIKLGQVLVSKVARGIFLLFMTLMVAGYLMHTRESILAFLRSLPPPRSRYGFDRLLFRIDRGLSGVVRGQLLICLLNGILSAIGFAMFGLKYWPIMAIVAGLMSIIPIFGSILSTIPAVLIGLTQSFWTALWVLLWIIGIHQVEANLLNPKIIGVSAKIHPVLVVFALVVGEHVYGLWGALLAVPALSLAQSIFNHFRFESLPEAVPDSIVPPAPAVPSRVPATSTPQAPR
jgi:predicted PurR-regulated permease PerM